MSKPLISIIVPCYNVEKFINNALQSIFLQTYTNWECILVDDGSKDNVSDEIDVWVKKDSRFKYFYQDNQGLSGARNEGLKKAKGEFIYFFDSDDLLNTITLENLYSLINDEIDIVIGKNAITEGQTNQISDYLEHYSETLKKLSNQNKDLIKLVVENPIICVAWNKLYRKSFLDKHQLIFKKGILHEDELWFFETLFHARAIIFNNKPTYYYNVANTNSITNNFGRRNLESYLEIIEYVNEFYYQKSSDKNDIELSSIYTTHLKIKAIQHCYKQLNNKDKHQANSKIKTCFERVQPTRNKKILTISFEDLHYHFKIAEVLEPKNILKFLRYFNSSKIFRKLKSKILLQKAFRINSHKNRFIKKVY
ncbi:glycosyltransferase family 2 protein [Bizionia arctica]|uniref:Glycosyl transferase n=1 Tax=Bizionia arctica TaxID=1495645 RepID=A0A917LUD2_9FLAO|nr:glycosyltransferase family 2 protein [Bizionia arctica]GGG57451.1 glycosyl transferase [Bizionia arctica]